MNVSSGASWKIDLQTNRWPLVEDQSADNHLCSATTYVSTAVFHTTTHLTRTLQTNRRDVLDTFRLARGHNTVIAFTGERFTVQLSHRVSGLQASSWAQRGAAELHQSSAKVCEGFRMQRQKAESHVRTDVDLVERSRKKLVFNSTELPENPQNQTSGVRLAKNFLSIN